jgi:YVTN family beta-propeller protein
MEVNMLTNQRKIVLTIMLLLFVPPFLSAQWLETTISVGSNPYALVYNPVSVKVYCANYSSDNVTVIDGETNTVIATIAVGDAPRALVHNSTNNTIYCANGESGNITVIDGANDNIIATINVGDTPRDLVYNPTDNKVYCANYYSGNVTVIDGVTNTVMSTIDFWAPRALVYNPTNNKVYCISYSLDGVIVIDGATDSIIANVGGGDYGYALGYNITSNKVYCAYWDWHYGRDWGYVAVIDGEVDTLITSIFINSPIAFTSNTFNNKVYCIDSWLYRVMVIDGVVDTAITTVAVGGYPHSLVYNSINNKVYCTSRYTDNVTVIDGDTDSIVATITVGNHPRACTWNPVQNRTYVANYYDSSVSVIRDSVTGIEELPQSASPLILDVYPNPTRAAFAIRASAPLRNVRIYDSLGELVKTVTLTKFENMITVSMNNMSAGVYFVRVATEDSEFLKKVVVTK